MKILYIAEITGNAGVWCVRHGLPILKKRYNPDFVIANADGATGCKGLGKKHAAYICRQGVNMLTSGDYVYYKKDLADNLDHETRILRAVNLPGRSPGKGFRICTVRATGEQLAVMSVLGQSGFPRLHADSPFEIAARTAAAVRENVPAVFVDFHAAATAEKKSFFYAMDGNVSVIAGSHGRVQTADAGILPGGTAFITDAGRTGSVNSVGGCEPSLKIKEYMTGIPEWTHSAWDLLEIQGFAVVVDSGGKASSIEPFRFEVPGAPDAAGEPD